MSYTCYLAVRAFVRACVLSMVFVLLVCCLPPFFPSTLNACDASHDAAKDGGSTPEPEQTADIEDEKAEEVCNIHQKLWLDMV